MARCQDCGKEMLRAHSCTVDTIIDSKGNKYKRIPYGQEKPIEGVELPERCHDCGVKKGGYHHWACDMEQCMRCAGGGQLISCECWAGEAAASG